MRSLSALAIVGAGLLPSAVKGAATPFLEVCTVNAVLEYFTCQHVSQDCFEPLVEQAEDWCRDYLSIEPVTIHASTVIPDLEVVTVVETTTVTGRTVDVLTTTEETTVTATATTVIEETVTVITTTTSTVLSQVVNKRLASDAPTTTAPAPAPSCVDLTKKNLLRHPAARLSKACSCLNPEPATITLPATTASAGETVTVTAPATATDVITDTQVTTVISSTVVTDVVTVTSTTTATATSTVIQDRCSIKYSGGGNGQGNSVKAITGVTSQRDCCERCLATPNCVASASSGPGNCQHLVKITQLAGAPTNAQCPLGVENYPGLGAINPSGMLFKGACVP